MHGKGAGAVNRVELECQVLCAALRQSWVRKDKVGAFTSIRELSHLFPDLLPPPEDREGTNKANYYDLILVRPGSGLNGIVVGYLKSVRKFLREYNPKDHRQLYNSMLNAGFVLRKPRLRLSHDLVVARRWLYDSQLEDEPMEEEEAQFAPPSAGEVASHPPPPQPAHEPETVPPVTPIAQPAYEPASQPAAFAQAPTPNGQTAPENVPQPAYAETAPQPAYAETAPQPPHAENVPTPPYPEAVPQPVYSENFSQPAQPNSAHPSSAGQGVTPGPAYDPHLTVENTFADADKPPTAFVTPEPPPNPVPPVPTTVPPPPPLPPVYDHTAPPTVPTAPIVPAVSPEWGSGSIEATPPVQPPPQQSPQQVVVPPPPPLPAQMPEWKATVEKPKPEAPKPETTPPPVPEKKAAFVFDESQLRKPEADIELPRVIRLMESSHLISKVEVQALKAQIQLAPNVPPEQLCINAGYATSNEIASLRLAQDLLAAGKITMAQFQVAMYDERTSGLRMAESLQVRGWLETEVKNPMET